MPTGSQGERSGRRPRVSGARRAVVAVAFSFVAIVGGIGLHAAFADDRVGKPRPVMATAGDDDVMRSGVSETGPTRLVAGVPAGFARTETGAVTAAASFVTTGQALVDMDPLAVEVAVRQMAAQTTADRQITMILADLRGLRDTLSAGSGPITFRQAALAARCDEFEPGRARVAVWSVGVLSREGIAAPQAGWRISAFDLVWERDDWRIETERITPGPSPTIDGSTVPATSTQLEVLLDGYTPLVSTRLGEGFGR